MERHYEEAFRYADAWKIWHDVAIHHMERSGDLRLARESLSKALAAAPEEPLVWYQQARLCNLEGQTGEERRYLEKIVEKGTGDLAVHHRLATLLAEEGNDERALAVLESARRIGPTDGQTLCLLGHLLQKRDRLQEAMETFLQAIDLQPDQPVAWKGLGEICLAMNRIDQAAEVFGHLLTVDPASTETLLRLCETALKRNRVDAFLHHCDDLLKVLGLDRRRVIHSMEDVADMLFDIGFAVRNDRESLRLLPGLLSLVPADYRTRQRTRGASGATPLDPEKTVIIDRLIEQIGITPAPAR